MGRPKVFSIEMINNPTCVYTGGQMMEGRINIQLEEPLSTRAIRVEFEGKAKVMWTETHSTGKSTYTVTYWNNEKYFESKIDLWTLKKDGNGPDYELPSGYHSYPFQFQLPPGIPSSFEERTGSVRYTIKAVIDRKFAFDYNTKMAFTVLQHLDLNTSPDLMMEGVEHNHKFLCCLCCKSGPITGMLRIPRRGYVPGEVIIIDADIENLSRRKMAKTTVRILQVTSFHATTKTKTETKTAAELRHGPIERGKSDTWRGERLVVPPLAPSFLHGCRIIDVVYLVQLNVDPTGLAFDLKVPVEVVIGTIPLRQALDQYSAQGFHMTPSAFGPALTPLTSDQIYSVAGTSGEGGVTPAMPPPSYSACVFGPVDIKESGDDKEDERDHSFAPAYAYYNWGFESTTATTSTSGV